MGGGLPVPTLARSYHKPPLGTPSLLRKYIWPPVTFTSEEDAVTIEITDEGRSFDPLNDAPEPDLMSPIEERQVGGPGVYLARTMMDELVYRREGNRNYLTLMKRRT